MQVVMMGNILDAVAGKVARDIPYVEEKVLKGSLSEILPERGLVIEAKKEELRDNPELGKVLYHDVEIKAKENAV